MELGAEIGRGLRSVVYAWGEQDVVKVPNPATPTEWLGEELRLMDAAARVGAPVPGRRRIVTVAGTRALAMERITGPSLWDSLVAEPHRARAIGGQLADIQIELASCSPGYELPSQRDRLVSKVYVAAREHGDDLLAVLDHLPSRDESVVLCHGDLHPRNVLVGDRGRVLVDWYDASRGAVGGETARTALMLEVSRELGVDAASEAVVAELRSSYLTAATAHFGFDNDELVAWTLVQRVARLAEGLGCEQVDELRATLAKSAR